LGASCQNWGSIRKLLWGVKYHWLQRKRQFASAAKFQNSIISSLEMAPPAECRPGRMPPPSRRQCVLAQKSLYSEANCICDLVPVNFVNTDSKQKFSSICNNYGCHHSASTKLGDRAFSAAGPLVWKQSSTIAPSHIHTSNSV